MIKDLNIICVSTIDWDFIWQGHQEIMTAFAKNGNRVIFIENTGARPPSFKDLPRIKQRIRNWLRSAKCMRKESENLYIYSPMILPFPYSRIARSINRWLMFPNLEKWMKVLNFTKPVIWTYLPTPFCLDLIDQFSDNNIIVYYCLDKFSVSSVSAKKIKSSEIKLLRKADIVFTSSKELYDYCSSYNKNVHLFPNSVSFGKFERAFSENTLPPAELKDIKHPIIGYVGGLHKWINQPLVDELARRFPDYSFVFAGPVQTDVSLIAKNKNVYFLGKKEHNRIPYLIKYYDVCLIPYLIADYTNNVYPTKLNEYHAMGKPVISTLLPEVINFNKTNNNIVLLGNSAKEFGDCINEVLNNPSPEFAKMRINSAKNNDWSLKTIAISKLLKATFSKKKSIPVDWRASLSRFYGSSKKKVIQLVCFLVILYCVTFYTPVVWSLGTWLKFSQEPSNADCIVVLAGGGGESGKAGQGFEERVNFATGLYKSEYAKNMLFCSRYSYAFKEPLVMKVLAVSLGVPENAILLEEKARNAYEHSLYIKQVCEKHNWKRIILVSSPYHMRRLSLVFNKNAANLKVFYVPIKNSLFYSHDEKDSYGNKIWKCINLQQVQGIIHEYLAIAYYKLKGKI